VCEQIEGGVELVLGLHRDPEMGLVLMAGGGGVFLEILNDVAFAGLPITLDEAQRLIERLRIGAVLRGYRGGAAHDRGAIARSIVALAELGEDLGDIIDSVDINPLLSQPTPAGVIALDAVVVLRSLAGHTEGGAPWR
jgi:acyl-CoA synthetase (NDP forming)